MENENKMTLTIEGVSPEYMEYISKENRVRCFFFDLNQYIRYLRNDYEGEITPDIVADKLLEIIDDNEMRGMEGE